MMTMIIFIVCIILAIGIPAILVLCTIDWIICYSYERLHPEVLKDPTYMRNSLFEAFFS